MIRKFVLVYLIVVFSFAWGYAAIKYQLFPGKLLVSAENVAKTIFSKKPDLAEPQGNENMAPDKLEAQLADYESTAGRGYHELDIPGLKERDRRPLVYFDDTDRIDGYGFLYGTFDFNEHLHGAILIDKDGQVIHRWTLSESRPELPADAGLGEISTQAEPNPPEMRWPHGIAVFGDGSIIVTDDNRGLGMFKLNLCSEVEWVQPGRFNDVIGYSPGSGTWTISDENIIELDTASGREVRKISLNEIHLANPDIAVFTPKRSLRVSKWYHDPVHLNDVEPLTPERAESFPMFAAGDLLLSFRSLNLVAVLDPETLVIKWWRTGISQRQSDVDWEVDGTISVYDNNQRDNPDGKGNRLPESEIRYSRIIRIDPSSMDVQLSYHGKTEKFYSPMYGKHQILPGGNILITSPEQGRFLEVNQEGATVYEFINRYNDTQALKVSEAKWLPRNFFSVDFVTDLGCE